MQELEGWEETPSTPGDRAMGQDSRKALLWGRQVDEEERGSCAEQSSPRKERLPLTSFSLLP